MKEEIGGLKSFQQDNPERRKHSSAMKHFLPSRDEKIFNEFLVVDSPAPKNIDRSNEKKRRNKIYALQNSLLHRNPSD